MVFLYSMGCQVEAGNRGSGLLTPAVTPEPDPWPSLAHAGSCCRTWKPLLLEVSATAPEVRGRTLPDADAGSPHHHLTAAGAGVQEAGLERGLPAVSPKAHRSGGRAAGVAGRGPAPRAARLPAGGPGCHAAAADQSPAGGHRLAQSAAHPRLATRHPSRPALGRPQCVAAPLAAGGEPHRELKAWHPNAALANIQWAVWTYGALQAGCRASGWTHDPPRAACQQHRCWTARDVADAVRAES